MLYCLLTDNSVEEKWTVKVDPTDRVSVEVKAIAKRLNLAFGPMTEDEMMDVFMENETFSMTARNIAAEAVERTFEYLPHDVPALAHVPVNIMLAEALRQELMGN